MTEGEEADLGLQGERGLEAETAREEVAAETETGIETVTETGRGETVMTETEGGVQIAREETVIEPIERNLDEAEGHVPESEIDTVENDLHHQ